MSKMKKITIILSVILALLLIGATYVFAFPLKASSRMKQNRNEFVEGGYDAAESFGFVDANTLSNTEKLVAENKRFKLFLDETTSHFYIYDKVTQETIESNPRIEDPAGPAGYIAERQKATLEYRYFNKIGVKSSGNNSNYRGSISHKETPAHPEGHRTFKLKELEDGFQVYYKIVDLSVDYLYFPKYLEEEVLKPIFDDRTHPLRRILMRAYSDVLNDQGLYEITNYEKLTDLVIKDLYKVFYEDKVFGEYTRERAIEENAKYGYFDEIVKFSFEVAVEVKLTDLGVDIRVINDSIKEFSDSKLYELTLYPHFGTAIDVNPETGMKTEGYMVIPDGSGAVIEFNNDKHDSRSYVKRLYGLDTAILPFEMPETQEKINIPVYGMVKENIGFAAIITEGDALATLRANISGGISNNSYNQIYPSFTLRQDETAVLGSGWNTHVQNIWSRDLVSSDLVVKYVILDGEDNSYIGIANAYRDYLIKEKGLEKIASAEQNKVLIELLGAYDKEKRFLGVPYKAMESLTNFDEAKIIVEELNKIGLDQMDIIYSGMTNGGLNNSLEKKVKFEKTVGSKRKFKKFEEEMKENNIDIYPTANFFSTNSYDRLFDQFKYTSKRVIGELSRVFEYHMPTRLPYSQTQYNHADDHYAISPVYYETLYNKYNKSYQFDNLALVGIGSNLTANYIKNNEIYLNESLMLQERMLQNVSQKLVISNPLGFALPYTHTAADLPVETTLYSILDYQIPLVQLVLSGYINYTTASINLPSSRDVDYQFLKALETGSSLKYTLSYNSSLQLLGTDHSKYTSTEYTNWLDIIEEQVKVVKENNLNNAHLVGHERLANNVFKSIYSNNLEIIVNYNLTPVTIDGEVIEPINFIVRRGN